MFNFNKNKQGAKELSKVQGKIDKFLKDHPKRLNEKEHKKLRSLLNKRAKAMSKASGQKIHSLFD